MIRNSLTKFKPGGQRRTHLLLAACLWTSIGILLLVRASHWLWPAKMILLLPAFALGTLKSLFILDKAAKRVIERILRLADGTCLGAVYSIKTWLLVLVMMASGMVLRRSSLSPEVLGVLYGTIGWALLFSSRNAWRAWNAKNSIFPPNLERR